MIQPQLLTARYSFKPFLALITAAIFLLFPCAKASSENTDIVFQAMQDELVRSMKDLKLNGHSIPYFISYRITEYDTQRLTASCGALTDNSHNRWRTLKTDVRVGDYHLDSSGFSVRSALAVAALLTQTGTTITAEDDYDALRNTLWFRTDSAYKTAIKNFEAKKNFLEQNNIQERPDDFSQASATTSLEKLAKTENCDQWRQITKNISAIFADYPLVQRSTVNFTSNKVSHWLLNSEGTKVRQSENQYSFIVMASLQANNGMQLADSRLFCANSLSDMPKEEEIRRSVKDMINNLIALHSAPLAKEYRGPILLEGQAAAEFVNGVLRYNFGHAQEVLSSSDNTSAYKRNPLKNLLNRQIMPTFISVVDDPLTDKFKGHPVIGGYKVDEEGVPAQKVQLVEKGILKNFCTSRTPIFCTNKSNGHAIGNIGEASMLYFNSDNQVSGKELKEKLIELGKKAGLKQVMLVRRLATYDSAMFNPGSLAAEIRANASSSGANSLFVRSPLLLYAISTDDGHEELVRGALFSSISIDQLRDIVCTGDDAKPYLTLSVDPAEMAYFHLICPSLLFSDLQLHEPDRETDKLPILPNPLGPQENSKK